MDVDTSSYPKPVQSNFLDQAAKYQSLAQGQNTIQQQGLAINQAKLDQANQALGYMTRAMGSLGPNATKDQYAAVAQNAVKMGLVPANMLSIYTDRLNAAPDGKSFYNEFMTAAADHQQQLDYHLGRPGTYNNGQQTYPTAQSQKPGFGIQATGAPIQNQPPPTTPVLNEQGQPSLLGPRTPVAPPGVATGPGQAPQSLQAPGTTPQGVPNAPGGDTTRPSLPIAAPSQTTTPVRMLPVSPNNNMNLTGPGKSITGMSTENVPNGISPADVIKNRFAMPSAFTTGFAPGVKEAADVAGQASGTQLANDRAKAANFQRDIFPLTKAIPALEALGTKGTGPGTETINNLKSFVLSNVPGVKASDFNGTVKDYDEAKKYLTDFVNQTGNSGTNDKLAAAFAGNPSTHISNAAAVDVAKSALSLRRMQQAQILEFEKSGQPADTYSSWLAKRTNELDPRAFGVDLMDGPAKTLLLTQLNKNPTEKSRFENSLELAHSLGFVTPPNGR